MRGIKDCSSKAAILSFLIVPFDILNHSFLLWIQIRSSIIESILNGIGIGLSGLSMICLGYCFFRYKQR